MSPGAIVFSLVVVLWCLWWAWGTYDRSKWVSEATIADLPHTFRVTLGDRRRTVLIYLREDRMWVYEDGTAASIFDADFKAAFEVARAYWGSLRDDEVREKTAATLRLDAAETAPETYR